MTSPTSPNAMLEEWIGQEALPFSLDALETFNAAVDAVVASLGDGVTLLGLGEALHGGEELLILRNRLMQRLVEAHGFSAIALESSYPRGGAVNAYVAGRGPASYAEIEETGFSHHFGKLDANRELVEWMRRHNADPAHPVTLRFYGFDSPTELGPADSPRQLLQIALDSLTTVGPAGSEDWRRRFEPLLGEDAAWEDPAAIMDPAKSIGRSPEASALRIETEELLTELQTRRPELIGRGGRDHYRDAVHAAKAARQLLTYHAVLASEANDRLERASGLRDAMMADNLAHILAREDGRGKVLAFAHNVHLQRGQAAMQLGPHLLTWWPAGAQLDAMLGPHYAVIGAAVGVSQANSIGQPEAGTLEALLTAAPGPGRFIPTRRARGLPEAIRSDLPTRSGSVRHPGYFPLTPRSLTDFDWLVTLDAATYSRGAPPLPS